MSNHEEGGSAPKPPLGPPWSSKIFLTFRGRLILLICLAATPAMVFILFSASKERKSALVRMESEVRHLGNLASREHAQQLQGAKNLLRHLAGVLTCEAQAPATSPRCPGHLPELLSGLPQLANIGLAAANGEVTCSAASIAPSSLKGNMAFERSLGSTDTEVGEYVIGFVGRPVVHLTYAIRAPHQAPCAVAFVAVELSWLDRLAEQAHLPAGSSLFIADRSGHILARSADFGRETLTLPDSLSPPLKEVLDRPGAAILELAPPGTRRYLVATPMEGIPGLFVGNRSRRSARMMCAISASDGA